MLKGTLLHELISLPFYWKEVIESPDLTYPVEKRFFGDHPRQYCLFARPERPPTAWVVYWHGGGWQFGSPEQFKCTTQTWLEAGYGVVIPSYRRLPWYDYRAIRHDTVNALLACRKYWDEYNDDPYPPVLLTGVSAGGHLASITGLDNKISREAGWQTAQIKGVIACGAVLDFSTMKNNPLIRRLAGSSSGAIFRQANPKDQLKEDAVPFVLIHGTNDGMVPYQAAINFRNQHQSLNTRSECELITLEKGTHLDAARWILHDNDVKRKVMKQVETWLPIAG